MPAERTGFGATGSVAPSPPPAVIATPAPAAVMAPPAAKSPPQKPVISAPPIIDQALVRYDPASEPKKTVNLQVVAFTLLGLAGAGGLSLAGAPVAAHNRGAAAAAKRPSGKVTSAKVKHAKGIGGNGADGDSSRTWRWPGTAWLDAGSVAAPTWLATRSPLLARVLGDASYLRAMSGSLSLVLPLAGVALGALAVGDVHGHALAPSLGLTTAIAVLGVLDAAGGMVKLVLMLFVGKAVAAVVFGTIHDPRQIMAWAFILLAIPGLVLGTLDLFGREGDEPEMTWSMRVVGTVIFACGILFVAGVVD